MAQQISQITDYTAVRHKSLNKSVFPHAWPRPQRCRLFQTFYTLPSHFGTVNVKKIVIAHDTTTTHNALPHRHLYGVLAGFFDIQVDRC